MKSKSIQKEVCKNIFKNISVIDSKLFNDKWVEVINRAEKAKSVKV